MCCFTKSIVLLNLFFLWDKVSKRDFKYVRIYELVHRSLRNFTYFIQRQTKETLFSRHLHGFAFRGAILRWWIFIILLVNNIFAFNKFLYIWYSICRISRWICTFVSFGGTSVFRSIALVSRNWLLGQSTLIRYGFRIHSLSTRKLLIFIRQQLKINFYELCILVKF